MLRRTFCVFLTFTSFESFLFPAFSVDGESALRQLEAHLLQEMELNEIPGLSIAIIRSGELVYARAFGVKDLKSGEAMTLHTPVELASVSKSFTALALLLLEKEGKIDLDHPVQHYLPDFRVSQPSLSKQITVAHLLRHTSGLTRRADWLVPCCGMPGDLDLPVAVQQLRSAGLKHQPGSTFRYSNSNYILLAAIVEAVSGQHFPDYVQDRIISSLNLSRTTFDTETAGAWGLAALHERQWGEVRSSSSRYTGWYGASKIKSTASDMARYLTALLDEKKNLFGKLLAPSKLCRRRILYDWGWQIRHLDRLCVLQHSGNIWGANTAALLVPELQLGIVVLINAGVYRAEEIVQAVLTSLTGNSPPAPATVSWSLVPDNWSVCFAVGAAFMILSILYYGGKVSVQLYTGRRKFLPGASFLMLGRSGLLASMAICLFYLVFQRSIPPRASLPVTMQIAYPLFAGSLGCLFFVLALVSLAPLMPPREGDTRIGARERD